MIYQGLSKLADYIGDRAIADQVGIFLWWGAILIFLLLALWVRLWFDIARSARGRAERTRHVAQSVEGVAHYLARFTASLPDLLLHQPGRVDHAGDWPGDLGAFAANVVALVLRSAGADRLRATDDALVATGQRHHLVSASRRSQLWSKTVVFTTPHPEEIDESSCAGLASRRSQSGIAARKRVRQLVCRQAGHRDFAVRFSPFAFRQTVSCFRPLRMKLVVIG